MLSNTCLALALTASVSAHFILKWPPASFDDDTEGTSPCGGTPVNFNSSTPSIEVDRFAVSILSAHPEGQWTFKGTLDTQEPYTWTEFTPVINTTGLGTFCLDYLHAPSNFAGKPGVLQVTDNSVDGLLYQVSLAPALSSC
jgi:hypothetical protein